MAIEGSTAFEVFIQPVGVSQASMAALAAWPSLPRRRPVPTFAAALKLLSVEDKGGGRTLITAENTIEIEGEDKPALIANALVMALG